MHAVSEMCEESSNHDGMLILISYAAVYEMCEESSSQYGMLILICYACSIRNVYGIK